MNNIDCKWHIYICRIWNVKYVFENKSSLKSMTPTHFFFFYHNYKSWQISIIERSDTTWGNREKVERDSFRESRRCFSGVKEARISKHKHALTDWQRSRHQNNTKQQTHADKQRNSCITKLAKTLLLNTLIRFLSMYHIWNKMEVT